MRSLILLPRNLVVCNGPISKYLVFRSHPSTSSGRTENGKNPFVVSLSNHTSGEGKPHRPGFTLLEVFIAMAIFALVAVSVMRSLGTLLSNTAIISDDMRASLELNNAFTEPLIQTQQAKPEIKSTPNISVGQLPAQLEKSINAPMVVIRAVIKLPNNAQLEREILIPALPKDKS